MKTIKGKIAPNPKEAQFWIDLSADPHGNTQKYWNGHKWVEKDNSSDTDELKKQTATLIDTVNNEITSLKNIINGLQIELDILSKQNIQLIERIKKIEQSIIID